MKEKMIGSGIGRIRRKDNQFTLSLLMFALLVTSVTLLAVAFLVHQPVGADSVQPGITDVASPDADAVAAAAPHDETGIECLDDRIEPVSILPYSDRMQITALLTGAFISPRLCGS